ncbi:MAG TPA: DNA-binding response regulator [Firmicutes bacterium]|jgi:two-component system, response regulator YesN|nr:DNA-binding response regulator [Bacillota bacterium]
MTSLLLVEDEEAIKQKLMGNTQWAEYGFDPVFGACNGVEALAILEQGAIDIMVTDVQMPKMNGIELIKEVKKRNYQMKIIVISGFAEFEYAQESIKLNVADYLLKPFASRRLLEILLRLKKQIEQEQAEKCELEKLRENLRKNIQALREKFFMNLLNHNLANMDMVAELQFLGFEHLAEMPYQVVVVEIPEGLLRGTNEEEKYLLNFQFSEEVKQLLAGSPYNHFVVNQMRNQAIIIFFAPDQDLAVRVEEYLAKLQLALKQPIIIGVGGQYRGFQDLAVSYREARVASQYRYIHGANRVFAISDVNLDNPYYHKYFYSLYQNRIFDDLRVGAHPAIHEDIKSFIAEMRSSDMPPESLRIIASNLILLTFTTLNELGYSTGEMFETSFSPLKEVACTESLDELENFLNNFYEQINQYASQKRLSLNQNLVDKIRRHIDENYADDITLSDMAIQYKISPGYLSLLFTERTGRNFIDYLTERRIKKAQELLKHSDMKIYEIAGAVGYNDSYYFSNCFKKVVGTTPREFREQNN